LFIDGKCSFIFTPTAAGKRTPSEARPALIQNPERRKVKKINPVIVKRPIIDLP